jgi:hypothetical protein
MPARGAQVAKRQVGMGLPKSRRWLNRRDAGAPTRSSSNASLSSTLCTKHGRRLSTASRVSSGSKATPASGRALGRRFLTEVGSNVFVLRAGAAAGDGSVRVGCPPRRGSFRATRAIRKPHEPRRGAASRPCCRSLPPPATPPTPAGSPDQYAPIEKTLVDATHGTLWQTGAFRLARSPHRRHRFGSAITARAAFRRSARVRRIRRDRKQPARRAG